MSPHTQTQEQGRLHEGDSIRLGPWAKPHLVNRWAWSPSRADLCEYLTITCNFQSIWQINHSCHSWHTFDFLSLQKESRTYFPKTLSTALLFWFWWTPSISKGSGTRNLRKNILQRKNFGWIRYRLLFLYITKCSYTCTVKFKYIVISIWLCIEDRICQGLFSCPFFKLYLLGIPWRNSYL